MISFEEFKKLDLRVARILEAEKIPDSEKLLRLQIDLDEGKRQIIAGIGLVYKPEELVNKEIIIVANLEPKTFMGYESRGMLLVVSIDGIPTLLIPEKEVPPGSKIS